MIYKLKPISLHEKLFESQLVTLPLLSFYSFEHLIYISLSLVSILIKVDDDYVRPLVESNRQERLTYQLK